MALLGLLEENGAASGYDLTKAFEKSTSNVWTAKHSQIYPELRKMETDGDVTAVAEGARGKRTYRITDEGRTELRRWLVETDPNRSTRSEACLRMFMLPLLEPEEAVPLLRAEAAVYDIRITRLRSIAERAREEERTQDWYQCLMGVNNMSGLRDWASFVADDIEKRAAGA